VNPTDLPAFRLSPIHRRIGFLRPLIFLLTKAITEPFAKRTLTCLLGLLLVSTASPLGQAEGEKRKHWAFQPIVNPPIPMVPDRAWPSSPIDHFILRKLSEAGMDPSPKASPRTLIRRVYFDLIGLPPTSAEVAAFENEHAANPLHPSCHHVFYSGKRVGHTSGHTKFLPNHFSSLAPCGAARSCANHSPSLINHCRTVS